MLKGSIKGTFYFIKNAVIKIRYRDKIIFYVKDSDKYWAMTRNKKFANNREMYETSSLEDIIEKIESANLLNKTCPTIIINIEKSKDYVNNSFFKIIFFVI